MVLALAGTTIAAVPLPVAVPVSAHAAPAGEGRLIPLERVEDISVLVDDMTPDAETASLTRDLIQADAESQLLRNGLRVHASGSMPALYFQISVLCEDRGPCAVDVSSAAIQDVYLDATATSSIRAKTWYTGQIMLAPRAKVQESVRNAVRGQADEFAADVQAARRQALEPALTPAPTRSAVPPPTPSSPDSEPRRSN
ncbi:MAG: hypothetical protein ABIT71_16695 [Vicinamibacteraceae bacterium]